MGDGAVANLDETDVGGLLTEALTADVEPVLADKTSLVGADAARSAALAVRTGAGVPNVLVGHDFGLDFCSSVSAVFGVRVCRFSGMWSAVRTVVGGWSSENWWASRRSGGFLVVGGEIWRWVPAWGPR